MNDICWYHNEYEALSHMRYPLLIMRHWWGPTTWVTFGTWHKLATLRVNSPPPVLGMLILKLIVDICGQLSYSTNYLLFIFHLFLFFLRSEGVGVLKVGLNINWCRLDSAIWNAEVWPSHIMDCGLVVFIWVWHCSNHGLLRDWFRFVLKISNSGCISYNCWRSETFHFFY